MALLQVRNFPDDLYEKIKQQAERENRSIAQQASAILQLYYTNGESFASMGTYPIAPAPIVSSAQPIETNKERRRRVLAEIRQFHLDHPGMFKGMPDGATLVREGREENDRKFDHIFEREV